MQKLCDNQYDDSIDVENTRTRRGKSFIALTSVYMSMVHRDVQLSVADREYFRLNVFLHCQLQRTVYEHALALK